ncbi:MAG TPA: radical SAM protein [Clostridiaceae bacterium]|nr:radical SAM protein [Clostridiaceae bacterium]
MCQRRCKVKKHKLAWVDDFIMKIKPYIYMRLIDNVLIRMPNEAFKLNSTGAKVIDYILSGGSVQDIIKARRDYPETEEQLERFFTDFSLMWNGRVCENYNTPAIHRTEFNLGYIKLPVLSEVALTYTCNVRCRFCYADCTQKEVESQLDTEGFKRVLDIIRYDAQVPSVSFTGGEPTTYKELTELIRYASKNNKMRVNLITNGTLITPQKAKEFAEAGLSSAQVSIESAIAREHDEITGVKGSHQASVNGLKSLIDADIIAHPHLTVCTMNKDNLQKYPEFCKSIGVERFSSNLVIPSGRGEAQDLTVEYQEIGNIVENLQSAARSSGVEYMWYSPTPICLFNPIAAGFGNKGCSACEGLLSVDPGGNILPCSSWSEPMGNLLEEGFEAIWFNKRSQFIRDKKSAPAKCRECRDFAVCQGACPLYFDAHGCEELEAIWDMKGLKGKEYV